MVSKLRDAPPDVCPRTSSTRTVLRHPSAARRPRGEDRGRPLPLLLGRALHPRLPDADRRAALLRQIATGNRLGAAETILVGQRPRRHLRPRLPDRDPLQGLRAGRRRGPSGQDAARLQRFATEAVVERAARYRARAAPTGRRVAVVSAGPTGLACAHELARLGHDVTIFERSR